MTRTLLLKMVAGILLVGTASAAIYTGIYSEAVISFNTGSAPPDGTPISNLVEYDNEMRQNINIGEVNTSEMHTVTVRQRNAGEDNYTSTTFFEVSCDEGLVPLPDYPGAPSEYAATMDFVVMNYTDHHGVTHDCNQYMRWVSGSTIRVTPPMDAFTFVPGYVYHTQIDVQLDRMAYGNYTIEVHVV